MKKIRLLFLLLVAAKTYAQQPTMQELILPQYIIGTDGETNVPPPDTTNNPPGESVKPGVKIKADEDDQPGIIKFRTIPFVMRATLNMGQANAGKTFRYFAGYSGQPLTDEIGVEVEGKTIGIKLNGDFERSIYQDYFDTYGEFRTDASGNYTGWFIIEPTSAPAGVDYYIQIVTNDGAGSEAFEDGGGYIFNTSQTVRSVAYETNEDNTECASVRSTPAAGGNAKNFVFLYDNEAGTGRPVSGSYLENDNIKLRVADGDPQDNDPIDVEGYPEFYISEVDGKDRTWATIIPHVLPGGIKRIAQYKLTDGSLVGFNTSSNGVWPSINNKTVDTKNPVGGLENILILDGSKVNLLKDSEGQTITFSSLPSPLAYRDTTLTLTATSTAGLPVTFTSSNTNVATVTGNQLKITGAGEAVITATAAGNNEFNEASATQNLIVSKASQAITFSALAEKTYGDEAFTVSASINSDQTIQFTSDNPQVATIAGNRITITGAGNANITAAQPGNTNYSTASPVIRVLTVKKAALTITADDKPKALNQPLPTLTVQYSGFKYRDTPKNIGKLPVITTTALQNSPPGTYPIVASGATSANYLLTYVDGTLTVYGEALEISFNDIPQKTYGDGPFDPGATAESETKPVYSSSNTQVADVNENGQVVITGAGTAVIAASFPASGTFPPGIQEKELTVAKKPLQIAVENTSRLYGQPNPEFSVAYTGFANTDDAFSLETQPVTETTATTASPIGTYSIIIGDAASDKYSFSYTPGTLTINKALLTVTAGDAERPFGEQNPVFGLTYAGFVNDENESVLNTAAVAATSADVSSNAGTYPITPAGASAGNYEFDYVSGSLTVTPATPVITFNPLPVKTLGDADFDPGAMISGGEQAVYTSTDSNVATIVDGKIRLRKSGTTTITATTPDNANFTGIQTARRELIVKKAAQVITFKNIPILQRNAQPLALNVVSSSGLPVQLNLSDSTIATISGSNLKPLRVGTTQVIASQGGDDTYLPAKEVINVLTVTDDEGGVLRVHPALSADGDGINEFLTIEGIRDYPYNQVTIVDRNGIKVFDIQNYDNEQNVFRGKRNGDGGFLPAGTYFCLIQYNVNSEVKRKTSYFILKY